MVDDDSERARLFADAVRIYLEHWRPESLASALQPDLAMSAFMHGPSVALRTREGVPIGTVAWEGGQTATFEPPTKVTVVDHFESLRPTRT